MSISFNGSSSKLEWSGAIVSGYPYSMFCWVKPSSAAVSQMVIGSAGTTNGNEDTIYSDGAGPGKMRAFSRIEAGSVAASSTTSISTSWQPALAVFTNGNSRTIYYAGGAAVTDTTSCSTFSSAHQRVVVGTRARLDSLWFNGDIAEVAFWSSSLTQTDFDALAAGARPDGVASSSLVEYWNLKTQASSQIGKNGRVLTASNTSQGSTHPISASISSAGGIASTTVFGTPTVTSTYPYAISTAKADGAWTWFTHPEAVFYNGSTYFGSIDSAGTTWISKVDHSTNVITHFQLSATGVLIDDHGNASVSVRTDGRIVAHYGMHDDSTLYWRVSTNPEDISAFGAATTKIDVTPNNYPYPVHLSADSSKSYRFGRRRYGGGDTRDLVYRVTSDNWGSLADPVSIFRNDGFGPYWHLADDGTDTIHVTITDKHPNQGQASLYHFYIKLNGSNVLKYYKTDGTEITASLPFGPSEATLVYDGTTTKCWNSHIAIEPGTGYPRILYMKYPGNNGSAIEYWHARWNGSAWSSVKITDDGAGLYSPEVYYHGGLSFDGADPNTIWLSAPVSGTRQIQMWQTADSGATWAKARSITSGATSNRRLRPISPRNHDGSLPALWFDGTYTSFTDYSGEIKGFFTTNVDLIGVAAATATAGVLVPSISAPVAGSVVTPIIGSLGPNLSKSIEGQGTTGAVGTLSVTFSSAVSGVGSTTSAGTLGSQVSQTVVGQGANTAVGTLSATLSSALSGVACSTSAGSLTVQTSDPALSGQSATTSAGTLTGSLSCALAGTASATSAGILTAQATDIVLSGQQAATATGALAASITTTLSGAASSISTGSLNSGVFTFRETVYLMSVIRTSVTLSSPLSG